MTTNDPLRNADAEAAFLQKLYNEGWTQSDLQMFVSLECTQLRSFAHANVQSRVAARQ